MLKKRSSTKAFLQMATSTSLLIFFHFILATSAKDLMGIKAEHSGPNSNTVIVKYEGTQEEVVEFVSKLGLGLEFKRNIFGDWYLFYIPQTNSLFPKKVPDIHLNTRKAKKLDKKVKYIQQEKFQKRSKHAIVINDVEWPNQWNLQPSHTPSMNVYKAWEMGYTGKGVTVAIVDDGIDGDHPDLIGNYNSSLGYDFNTDTPDPSHKGPGDGHGTNVAGVVAAVKDTNCITGVAYESTITGLRLLGTPEEGDLRSVASIEAMCLTYNYQYIDIYSNSWGPDDEGIYMYPLDEIIEDAFEFTIKKGRNGKGAIYTFASGNSGPYDTCITDPYSSSMYTISVAAVNELGRPTSYSEPCTSILAATFSGDNNLKNITTTGPNGTCVNNFDGTSAACPQASGIIALTLQANPELTWRDIQHMIVEFSYHTDDQSLEDFVFYKNGAGKTVSIWTGFGLMNAEEMVKNASSWATVPPRISCRSGDLFVDRQETNSNEVRVTYEVKNCFIKYLEHVQVYGLYNTSYRGDTELYLFSPMGSGSKIFPNRPYDNTSDYTFFNFMSVHTWGEDPNGVWTLLLYPLYQKMGTHLVFWGLELFGTATDPLDGIPPVGSFGSPCNSSASCAGNLTCLNESEALCDNICVPCSDGYHLSDGFCEKDCPPLFFDDGFFNITSSQEGLLAEYSCYDGYSHTEGVLTRYCGNNGVWTGTEPRCDIDCGTLEAPSNGTVSFSGTTYDFIAVYSCNDGYILSDGDEERVCSDYGWNGSEPVCRISCQPLENPKNGNVTFNDTFEDSEAMYRCNEGYILSGGESKRVCSSNSKWSSDEPACLIDCGGLESPVNGTVNMTSSTEGSAAKYSCSTGYAIATGSSLRTCTSDGNWTGTQPICRKDCGPLESPANVTVTFSSSTEGSVATYTCLTGFKVSSGNVSRTCTDGDWTGVELRCVKTDVSSRASKYQVNFMITLCVGILSALLYLQ